MKSLRRILVCLIVAVVVLFFVSPWLSASWQNLRFNRSVHSAFDRPVRYVEFQANNDWPKQRVENPKSISALQTWLLQTEEISPLRSAPPPCVCEMRIVFHDGTELLLQHSPFREPLTNNQRSDMRSDVGIHFAGHYRSGRTDALAKILGTNQ